MADQSAPTLHLPGPPSQASLWADKIPEHSITTTTKARRLFSLLELKATTLFVFTRAPFPILDGVESVLFIRGAAISRNRAHVSSGRRISPALRCGWCTRAVPSACRDFSDSRYGRAGREPELTNPTPDAPYFRAIIILWPSRPVNSYLAPCQQTLEMSPCLRH